MENLELKQSWPVRRPSECLGNLSLFQKAWLAWKVLANPWMLFLDKLGWVKNPKYFLKRGGILYARGQTTDVNDIVAVCSGLEYPQNFLGFENISKPVVVDLGGHIGSFILYIKTLRPQARIYSFEPLPLNLHLLYKNLTVNSIQDVKVVERAVYSRAGRFYLDLSTGAFDAGQVKVEINGDRPNLIPIEAVTLKDAFGGTGEEKIDLLKMDIEGSEYGVVENSLNEFARYVRQVIMEYHPAGDLKRRDFLIEKFGRAGFRLSYETKNILGFINENLK